MLDKWHKKEKPVFTGITRGVGGFGFGAADDGGGATILEDDEDGTQSKPFTSIANAFMEVVGRWQVKSLRIDTS